MATVGKTNNVNISIMATVGKTNKVIIKKSEEPAKYESIFPETNGKKDDLLTKVTQAGMTEKQCEQAIKYIEKNYKGYIVDRVRTDSNAKVVTFVLKNNEGKEVKVQYKNGKLIDGYSMYRDALISIGVDKKEAEKLMKELKENYSDCRVADVKKDNKNHVATVVLINDDLNLKYTIIKNKNEKTAKMYRGYNVDYFNEIKDIKVRTEFELRCESARQILLIIDKVKIIDQNTVEVTFADSETESGKIIKAHTEVWKAN